MSKARTFMATGAACMALLSGCGGGSSSPSTVTVAASSAPASSTATISEKQALTDFLTKVKPFRDQGKAETTALNAAIDAFNQDQTTDNLHKLGDTFSHGADNMRNIGNKMATVSPPPALADAYQGYVEYSQQLANALDQMAQAASQNDTAAITADLGKLDNSGATHFKVALIQALTQQGITVPQWVNDMGSTK